MSRNEHDAIAKAAGINTVYPGNSFNSSFPTYLCVCYFIL